MSNKPTFTGSEIAAAGILAFAFAVIIAFIAHHAPLIGAGTLMLGLWPILLAVYDYDRTAPKDDNDGDN